MLNLVTQFNGNYLINLKMLNFVTKIFLFKKYINGKDH